MDYDAIKEQSREVSDSPCPFSVLQNFYHPVWELLVAYLHVVVAFVSDFETKTDVVHLKVSGQVAVTRPEPVELRSAGERALVGVGPIVAVVLAHAVEAAEEPETLI